MAHSGPHLYLAGEYLYNCGRVEYALSDSAETYLDFIGATGDIFDIAYEAGDIWLARDHPAQPIQRFNTSGSVVDFVPGSVLPRAHGLTIDDDGCLWVSDMEADLILCLELENSLYTSTWGGIKQLAD